MIILMAARPFLRLSTAPIIAWTVNEGSTPTIGPVTLVKGDAAKRAVDLIVQIMCVAPAPRTIAPYVIASFTAANANIIMWSASNVNPSKPVSNVRPSTPSSLTNVTSVGTPNVPPVTNGYPSRTISVTFNPW